MQVPCVECIHAEGDDMLKCIRVQAAKKASIEACEKCENNLEDPQRTNADWRTVIASERARKNKQSAYKSRLKMSLYMQLLEARLRFSCKEVDNLKITLNTLQEQNRYLNAYIMELRSLKPTQKPQAFSSESLQVFVDKPMTCTLSNIANNKAAAKQKLHQNGEIENSFHDNHYALENNQTAIANRSMIGQEMVVHERKLPDNACRGCEFTSPAFSTYTEHQEADIYRFDEGSWSEGNLCYNCSPYQSLILDKSIPFNCSSGRYSSRYLEVNSDALPDLPLAETGDVLELMNLL